MAELQTWFAPLLWILGTITALVAFIRLCKPIWNLFQGPKEMTKSLNDVSAKLDKNHLEAVGRLDTVDATLHQLQENDKVMEGVQLSLLRDRLNQGYHYYVIEGELPEEAYRSFCEMYSSYKKLGGNSFIDHVMEQIHALYKESEKRRRQAVNQ